MHREKREGKPRQSSSVGEAQYKETTTHGKDTQVLITTNQWSPLDKLGSEQGS